MTVVAPAWRSAHSVAATRELARRALPRPIFDFADGGAENEQTLRRNESAFAAVEFLPRPLDGVTDRDLAIDLFGKRLALPVMIGPTGLSGLFWPGGEIAAAHAAAAAGTAFCLSHGSTCTIEDLAASGIAPRWMQVFVYRDRGFTREFVERAAASGYDALVLTIDNQLVGSRERDIRNGFTIPPRFSPIDIVGMVAKLPWLMRMAKALPSVTFANYARPGEKADIATMAAKLAGMLDPSLSWRDAAATTSGNSMRPSRQRKRQPADRDPRPRNSLSSSWMICPLPRTGPSSRCKLQLMIKVRLSSFSRAASDRPAIDSGSSISPSPNTPHTRRPSVLARPRSLR
jgi:FMN-dependent dehydrogenase